MLSDAPTRAKMRSTMASFAVARRHERAGLRQQADERGLPQVGGLAAHVRAGQDDELVRGAVQRDVVGHERVAPTCRSTTGWRPSHDEQLVALVHVRLGVVAERRPSRRAQPARRARRARGPCPGCAAPRRPRAARSASNSSISRSTMRSSAPSTFSSYSFSAGVMKRSPPAMVCLRMVVGGHRVQVRLRDLDVVAEHAVEAHLERRDAGARALALLDLGDHLLARAADRAQLVELGVDAVADEAAVARQRRRLVDERPLDRVAHVHAGRRARRAGSRRAAPAARRGLHARAASTQSDCFSADEVARARPCPARRARRAARGRARPSSASRNLPRSVVRKASSSTRVQPVADGLERDERAQQPRSRSSRPPIGVIVRSISSSSDPARVRRCDLDDLEVLERDRVDAAGRPGLPVGDGAHVREVGLLRVAQVADERARPRTTAASCASRPKPSRPRVRS